MKVDNGHICQTQFAGAQYLEQERKFVIRKIGSGWLIDQDEDLFFIATEVRKSNGSGFLFGESSGF